MAHACGDDEMPTLDLVTTDEVLAAVYDNGVDGYAHLLGAMYCNTSWANTLIVGQNSTSKSFLLAHLHEEEGRKRLYANKGGGG